MPASRARASVLDEAHDDERGEPFVPLAMPNCVSALVRDGMRAVGQPVRADDLEAPGTVDADDSREGGIGGERPEVARECAHLALGPRDVARLRGDRP